MMRPLSVGTFGRVTLAALVATFALLLPAEAAADPQFSAGVTTGLALTDLRADNAPRVAYHLGGRFDVLLLRQSPRDMAVGPYVDVATEAFDTFQAGGGLEWLVPAGDTAFIFSGGGFGRTSRFGWEPGVEATIFWGSRSYNYHSTYGLGVGLFLQGRYGFGDGKQTDALAGVQIDLAYFALPFVFLYEAVSH